ncbi:MULTISPECIES: thiamine phosphate synthase [unclassified Mesorhizobium]|uniref:thiamine phosphate synthase n=1 Tax=unclassified Mesorhizobium TaxID=325217 RepID=UPI000F751A86|nr:MULTISPECIES: thiamine phosphate synthase [unclassified Mesorhizobium]AZO03638.1 thiamine phosphate synthase [Mesorhizobium sp. M2A.F.Ca.ET.043.02.1.1]RUW42629.1 thiamine phosphate synthase [Mesorhizobium sp. M2A.F.Ca.ET.015.02.1.1]RUW76175.1 thiamine phosphate synthase [Mesorhizobium sp. M2A.F.Ca.ET.067.02.1.1]RVC95845.1 thiamine phosphate synthase [Mesorhizobium sp. M2A.F.Ca.ET.017.03.2.1]RVD08744.1 thiamine phosphate synthase [Mesorhizobium sp. M2A.F.Ca.ET.029.05.1.1]
MNDLTPPNRCRIVLIAPPLVPAEHICAAFEGGDVASLILPDNGMDDASFQAFAERIVPIAQGAGIAVIIAGDSRIAGRVQADGIHVEAKPRELAETIERLAGKMMVGAGGAKTRDEALELGEERPDYMFFGRFGYDNKPEPHHRNLALGEWWAEMISIPCIVMGGSELASVEAVAATGAEFVALSSAVFADGRDPAAAIAAANALLDETAPRFED